MKSTLTPVALGVLLGLATNAGAQNWQIGRAHV